MRATLRDRFRSSRLRRVWFAIALLLGLLIVAASPALAHKEHKKKPSEAAQIVQPPSQAGATTTTGNGPTAMDGGMGEMMDDVSEDRSKMTSFERLLDWLGRLHPMIVHFPIAFFPAALFTAIVGRRHPTFGKPVQFLVVAGGIIAPISAVLGWLDAIGREPDALLTFHRWLGTVIGVGALGLAVWAWRQPEEDRGFGMIIGLTVITAAIVVQGWYGGAIVHGMDHMDW